MSVMEWLELMTAFTSLVVTSFIFWRWMRKGKSSESRSTQIKPHLQRDQGNLQPESIHEDNHSDTTLPESETDSSATSDDERQTHVPYRSPVAVHDIVANKNGTGSHTNGTYSNKAFQQGEHIDDAPPTQKVAVETFAPPKERQRQESMISNLSVVFQVPGQDEKSFGEMVIEEFNHKSKTLHSASSDDAVELEKESSGVTTEPEPTNNNATNRDVTERLLPKQDGAKSLDRDGSSSSISHAEMNEEKSSLQGKKVKLPAEKVEKNTEWRDKLKNDLLNDDEEEFVESSEEENEDLSSISERSISYQSESTDEVDFNTKEYRQKTRSLLSQSSINKLLGQRALVIDNGSYLVRGGWAGHFSPVSCVRNVIGHWRAEASEAWQEALGSKFIGKKAIERHSTLALDHPVEDGRIGNWKGMREIWDHVANVEVDTELVQQPVLITEPMSVDRKQREKMAEVLIETLRVPGACLRSQAAMCALSTGHKVGLVVNCGYGTTEIVPMYEGYHLDYASTTMAVGGRHLTDYLNRLVQREHGVSFTSVAEMEIINNIKETYASVENDVEKNQPTLEDNFEYELPDGQIIQLGNELSLCTEPLFRPGLVGNSSLGLSTLIKQALDRLDPNIMNEGNNVVLLCGGGSNLMGLQERLEDDLSKTIGGANAVIQSTTCGDHAAWIGGSLLADQPGFSNMCLTEDMYFEYGANVVHRLFL